jgi:hypothetical protein
MLTVKAAGADVSKEAHLWPATVRDYRGPGRLDPPDWHGPIGGLVAWFQTQVRARHETAEGPRRGGARSRHRAGNRRHLHRRPHGGGQLGLELAA